MDYSLVWRASSVAIWAPVCPPGYKSLGHVATRTAEKPSDPVTVYRDDSDGVPTSHDKSSQDPRGPVTVQPAEFLLIWRHNGQSPVTMWKPEPPAGYAAIGTVVVNRPEQPNPDEVLCVRQDLCTQTSVGEEPIWAYNPVVQGIQQGLQGELNLQRLKGIHPETWRCSLWQVINPARTIMAVRGSHRPPAEAVLAPLLP
jgi:hypothetical protein